MGYLICKKCEVYYEVDEDSNDSETCEKCGGKLKYYDSFDDYYKEAESCEMENKSQYRGQEIIAVLIDEFKPPMKKDNLIIILTFALAILIWLISLLLLFYSSYYSMLTFILALVLWVVTLMLFFWRVNRLLRKLGLFGLLGGYGRYNDF